ncbi:MAG: RpiB/LacA/LacB family sugar-phosphate isomerase [Leptolinea sp.]|jgi:ribose 5-phosphate isomerase B|nr:RpiB/LacA/LacB family sugar-phosphate isomerase [Leptolinea sp.]
MDYRYKDVGVTDETDKTYSQWAKLVCEKIIERGYFKEGISICGMGIGMLITANKSPGIFAAVCNDSYSTERARLSNHANAICVCACVIGPELAKKIMKEWLSQEFHGGASQAKVDQIAEVEHSMSGRKSCNSQRSSFENYTHVLIHPIGGRVGKFLPGKKMISVVFS